MLHRHVRWYRKTIVAGLTYVTWLGFVVILVGTYVCILRFREFTFVGLVVDIMISASKCSLVTVDSTRVHVRPASWEFYGRGRYHRFVVFIGLLSERTVWIVTALTFARFCEMKKMAFYIII